MGLAVAMCPHGVAPDPLRGVQEEQTHACDHGQSVENWRCVNRC